MGDRAAVQGTPGAHRPAPESRCRGIRPRDDALAGGDRGGQRDPPGDGREFYRESHAKIYRRRSPCTPRASRSTPSPSSTRSTSAGSSRTSVQGAHPRAGRPRPARRRTRATMRASSTSRPSLRGLIHAGGEIARLGQRPGDTTELVDRAEQILFDSSQSALRASSPTSRSSSRKASSASRRCMSRASTRCSSGLRSRPHHVGIPGREPRDRRGAPQHGEVGLGSASRRTSPCARRRPSRSSRLRCRSPRSRSGSCAARRRSSRSASAPASSRPRTGRG